MNVQQLKGSTVGFLASGGLDSVTITRWLTDNGVNVVSFTADLGQPDEPDLEAVRHRMLGSGAVDAVVLPLRTEIAEAGLAAVQAQARYEGGYWNTTPLGRYVTVRGVLPELARRGISVLSHGATGRGNDQVRFQLITNMLAPEVSIYAPWRDPAFVDAFGGRDEMLAYCSQKGLPVDTSPRTLYSNDANLLGLTHEAGRLESLDTPETFISPGMGVHRTAAPDRPERVEIRFERGRPALVNGKSFADPADVLAELNSIAGRNAVGIALHLVENRFVGVKSRGIYEAPGMELLGEAYALLLQLLLDRRALRVFDFCSAFLGEQLYQANGEDFASSLAWSAIDRVTALATGTITVDLYKGHVGFVAADDVPHSLYVEENSSMANVGDFDHVDSEGLLRVLGIGAKVAALKGQVPNTLPG
ncbi:MAG: argininosuccinate synthase [Actinomycetota bacterium]|nr:argininosuccinate synthase [Actinomycetota bacterium]